MGHDFSKTGGPTQIFNDHILVCFIKETIGIELLDHFNLENVCWESDYPHSDGTWPNAPEELAKSLTGLNTEQVAKLSHENAMKHYGFDPFAYRPKEQCTAKALREESPDVDVVTRAGREADRARPGGLEETPSLCCAPLRDAAASRILIMLRRTNPSTIVKLAGDSENLVLAPHLGPPMRSSRTRSTVFRVAFCEHIVP